MSGQKMLIKQTMPQIINERKLEFGDTKKTQNNSECRLLNTLWNLGGAIMPF